MNALGLRVTALEARVAEVETSYGKTLYNVRRDTVQLKSDMSRILAHMGLSGTTQDEVDELLDAE